MKKIELRQVTTMPKRHSDRAFIPTENQFSVFGDLVQILTPYAKLMRVEASTPQSFITEAREYEVWTTHPYRKHSQTLIEKQKKKMRLGVLFAGVSIRKENVGLYFFPLYVDQTLREKTLKEKIPESLIMLLNGSTAFHIAELSDQLKKDIVALLKLGLEYYKGIGWV